MSSKFIKNEISYNKIKGVGLILIKRSDLVSELITTIWGIKYSQIGFFYETWASGKRQIKVLSIDITNIGSNTWLPILSLRKLTKDNSVTKISIKYIDESKIEESDFRNALISLSFLGPWSPEESEKVLSSSFLGNSSLGMTEKMGEPVNDIDHNLVYEWLLYIFCREIGLENKPTSINILNKFIETLSSTKNTNSEFNNHNELNDTNESYNDNEINNNNESDKESYNNEIHHGNQSYEHNELNNDNESYNNEIHNDNESYEHNELNNDNKSYEHNELNNDNESYEHNEFYDKGEFNYHLRETDLFGESYRVKLSRRKISYLNDYLIDPQYFMNVLGSTIMDLYSSYPDFSESLKGYMKYGRSIDPISEKVARRKLKNHIISSNNIIEYIISSIKGHNLDPSVFNCLYSEYNDVKESETILPGPIDENTKSIINVFSNGLSEETPESVLLSIKNQIERTATSISKGDIPIININDLSEKINKLIQFSGVKTDPIPFLKGETSVSCILTVTSNHLKGIPIKLRDNRKIILAMDGNDIGNYKHEELSQILSVLDFISDGDSRIDDLRSKIVDFLAIPEKIS